MERKEKIVGRQVRSKSMHVIDDLRESSSEEDDDDDEGTLKGSDSSASGINSLHTNSAQVNYGNFPVVVACRSFKFPQTACSFRKLAVKSL